MYSLQTLGFQGGIVIDMKQRAAGHDEEGMTNKFPPAEFTKAELLFFWLTLIPTTFVSTVLMVLATYFLFTGGYTGDFDGVYVYLAGISVLNFLGSLLIQFPVVYALGKRRRLNAFTAACSGSLAALPLAGLWWAAITIISSGITLDDALPMAVMAATSAVGGLVAYLFSWRYQPKPSRP